MKRKHLFILLGILTAGLTLRILLFSRIAPDDFYASPWYYGKEGDASEYSAIAANIVYGNGYTIDGRETTIRPPGYVYVLAGIYRIFGVENLAAVRVVHIALALTTLTLFWILAWRMTGNFTASHLATLGLALYPRYAIYNMTVLSETLFFALLLGAVCAADRFARFPEKVKWFALSMALLAIASLTRPAALYLAPVFLLWGWGTHAEHRHVDASIRKSATRFLLPGLVAFIIVLTPWVAYNHARMGVFTFSSKSGGTVAEAWDRTILEPLGISDRDILTPYQHLSEEEFAKIGYRLFFTEIRDHPLLIAKFIFLKFVYWFSPSAHILPPLLNVLYTTVMGIVMILGSYGAYRFWRSGGHQTFTLIVLAAAAFSAMHILTVPYHRYRFPVIDPYLILFASYAVVEMWSTLWGKKPSEKSLD